MEKKKIIIPVVTIAVIGAVGGTGYYYRDNVIDVATEAFDVVAEKIPFLRTPSATGATPWQSWKSSCRSFWQKNKTILKNINRVLPRE